jgi:Xaa-Pro aminopeptidase
VTAGYEAARSLLRPGVRMREVYDAGLVAVREAGLPQYSRGHFGHSIGLDNHQEEPPFIGPNDVEIRANMVLCLEVPFYPPDVGGFNIEDMFLITDTGAESLTHLRRDFRVLE